jgi:hypothetical protein
VTPFVAETTADLPIVFSLQLLELSNLDQTFRVVGMRINGLRRALRNRHLVFKNNHGRRILVSQNAAQPGSNRPRALASTRRCQNFKTLRTPITAAFRTGTAALAGSLTLPPGRTMYWKSGWITHHGAICAA